MKKQVLLPSTLIGHHWTLTKKNVWRISIWKSTAALTLQIYTVKVQWKLQLIQCKVYSVNCNSAAVMVYCLFGWIRSELDWMSKVQRKYYTGNFGQREKNVVFFVEILFAVHPSSPEKKRTMTKKWWCFGLLVGPFKVAATPLLPSFFQLVLLFTFLLWFIITLFPVWWFEVFFI